MYSISFIDDGAKIVRFPNTGIFGNGFYPALMVSNSYRTILRGLPPESRGLTLGRIGDKDTRHVNMKGNLFVMMSAGSLLPYASFDEFYCKPIKATANLTRMTYRGLSFGTKFFTELLQIDEPGFASYNSSIRWAPYADYPGYGWTSNEITRTLTSYGSRRYICESFSETKWFGYGVSTAGSPTNTNTKWRYDVWDFSQANPYAYRVATLQGKERLSFDTVLNSITFSSWADMSSSERHVVSCSAINPHTVLKAVTPENLFFQWGQRCGMKDVRRLRSDTVVRSNLWVTCVNNTRYFSSNLGKYIADFRGISETIQSFSGLSSLSLKSLTDAELSYWYGVRLQAADTKSLIKAARRAQQMSKFLENHDWSSSRSSARETIVTDYFGKRLMVAEQWSGKLYYSVHDNRIVRVIGELIRWDLFPTTNVAYDLQPYSFVGGWLMPIKNVLNAIDANTLQACYRILGFTYSRRVSYPSIPVQEFLHLEGFRGIVCGNLSVVIYDRWVTKTPPPLTWDLVPPSDPLSHWWEGGLLLLQRIL